MDTIGKIGNKKKVVEIGNAEVDVCGMTSSNRIRNEWERKFESNERREREREQIGMKRSWEKRKNYEVVKNTGRNINEGGICERV